MSLGTAVTRGLVAAVAPRLVDAVLDNLVENAIHHAGEGEAIVRGLSGAVEIVVHDTGGRIPPDHLARVFERFYRIEDARSGPGTGLGLAIVGSTSPRSTADGRRPSPARRGARACA